MARKLKTYDPSRILITYGPHKLEGFAPDSRIDVTYPVTFNDVEGSDGEVARGKTNASALTIVCTLLQTSDSNTFLNALFFADVNAPSGAPLPFFMKDLDGLDYIIAPGAWIPQLPQNVRKSAVGAFAWKWRTGPCEFGIGGHVKKV